MRKTYNKTCGITHLDTAKRAALLFDEVMLCVPNIRQYETPASIRTICPVVLNAELENFAHYLRAVEAVWREKGVTCVPVLDSSERIEPHLDRGKHYVLQAALEGLPVVVEEGLEWEQVMEFRSDEQARWKYAAFRQWLHSGLAATSKLEASDSIARMLADYEWAIEKHGLQTMVGTAKLFIQPKQLAAVSSAATVGALVAGPVGSVLAGGLAVTASVTAYAVERRIELGETTRQVHPEVALLYDLKRLP
ncbi:hypothetical protein J2T60_001228 [Natronospira proteinivora]|uniref:Uncharacterized protein n=1 Tax=Natronospira proteinivora TaxID=1807133 RepID=A0ABT1GAD2_9GAMM|nr:hypothetical protein [Natronospira proteinivora]MCP1727263.1 hypothetical protein [Natronospira proteinivora]